MITAWDLTYLIFALLWLLLGYAANQKEYDSNNMFYESVCFIVCGIIIVRLMLVAFSHKDFLSAYIIF